MANINDERRGQQRRRFVRVQSKFVVSYKSVHDTLREMEVSYTKDLSLGGMLFTSDRNFGEGTLMEIKMQLPNFPGPLVLIGKVLESKKDLEKKLLYNVRVEFVRIKNEDMELFKNVMDFLWRQHKITSQYVKQFKIDRRNQKD